jgi:hypothetical protein
MELARSQVPGSLLLALVVLAVVWIWPWPQHFPK